MPRQHPHPAVAPHIRRGPLGEQALPVRQGCNQVRHIRPNRLIPGIAQRRAGRRVEIDNPPPAVEGDYGLHRGGHNGIQPGQGFQVFRTAPPVVAEQLQQQGQQGNQHSHQRRRQQSGQGQGPCDVTTPLVRCLGDHLDPGKGNHPRLGNHAFGVNVQLGQAGAQGVIGAVNHRHLRLHKPGQAPDAFDIAGLLAQASKDAALLQGDQPAVEHIKPQSQLGQGSGPVVRRVQRQHKLDQLHLHLRQRPLPIVRPRFTFLFDLAQHIARQNRNADRKGQQHKRSRCHPQAVQRQESE